MPYPNFYAARITSPKQYTSHRYQKNKFGQGIDVVWGIKDGKAHIQAIRFAKSKFSASEAKAWLKRHGHKAELKEDAGPASTIMGPAAIPTVTTQSSDIARFANKIGPMVSRQGDRKKKTLRETLEMIVDGKTNIG
jgi:hypothetical protein